MRVASQDLEQFLRKVYSDCKADDFSKISYNLNSDRRSAYKGDCIQSGDVA